MNSRFDICSFSAEWPDKSLCYAGNVGLQARFGGERVMVRKGTIFRSPHGE